MLSVLQFSIFLLSSFVEDFVFVSFQQKNGVKKRNTLTEFKYLLFRSRIDLFDVKDSPKKFDRWQFDQKICLKGIWCCSFHGQRNFAMETFLGGGHMTSSSTKTAKKIKFKLCTHISNRLLHKTLPVFFLIMSHSFFIAIIWGVLKAYFAWKQLKVDYSKNTWKEENRGHSFVCLLVGYISVKKIIENFNSAGAGAHKLGKSS